MFFLFIMTAMLGGFLVGRGLSDEDLGVASLGAAIFLTSVIANGFVGVPW